MARSLHLAAAVAFAVALSSLPPTLARADEEPPATAQDQPPPSLLLRLGQPARAEVVEALLIDVRDGRVDPSELATALGHAGGSAACGGLSELVRHDELAARTVSLSATSTVALRHHRLTREVRRIVEERRGREQRLAIEALGKIGDGRDMPFLLEAAAADDRDVKLAACRALRALTGAEIPPLAARWRWHWHTFEHRANAFLPEALDAIEDDPEDQAAEHHVGLVLRYGWADLPLIDEALGSWFQSPDRRLRRIACRLAAELRLTSHVRAVQGTLAHAGRESPERQAALDALEALGVADASTNTTSSAARSSG